MPKITSKHALLRETPPRVELIISDNKMEQINHKTDRLLENIEIILSSPDNPDAPPQLIGKQVIFDYHCPAHRRYEYTSDDHRYRPKESQLYPSLTGETQYLFGYIERIYRAPINITLPQFTLNIV